MAKTDNDHLMIQNEINLLKQEIDHLKEIVQNNEIDKLKFQKRIDETPSELNPREEKIAYAAHRKTMYVIWLALLFFFILAIFKN